MLVTTDGANDLSWDVADELGNSCEAASEAVPSMPIADDVARGMRDAEWVARFFGSGDRIRGVVSLISDGGSSLGWEVFRDRLEIGRFRGGDPTTSYGNLSWTRFNYPPFQTMRCGCFG